MTEVKISDRNLRRFGHAVFDSVGWSTTTYNDTLQADTLYYLGEVIRFATCSATVKLKSYNASKSNTALLVMPPLVLIAMISATSVITVSPNPFNNFTTLAIPDFKKYTELNLKIYDLFGREVRKQKIPDASTIIRRNDLHRGIYFYTINSSIQTVSTGKFIVE